MENMDKDSTAYRSGEYEEMFNAAEIASMAAEDIVAYRNSIMVEMERQSALEFAKEEGIEQGIEKGKIEVAREMKKRGMSPGDIMLFTGLSKELIETL